MNKTIEQFVEMADAIYYRGMLDFEITCEKNIMIADLTEEERDKFQNILDESQRVFEEENEFQHKYYPYK